ncbi:hypothetical protein FQN57_003127 [Myotisia sp. PD_48]|nr:hypothetical protein FQN57_003127 [Myotisia sp. PD_48]
MRLSQRISLLSAALLPLTAAHFQVVEPPTRGSDTDKMTTFPCGGYDTPSSSRTQISLDDPRVAIAMKMGHDQAAVQVLLGLGNNPGSNFNISVVPTFRQMGLGDFCLSSVGLGPDVIGFEIEDGMNATLQVLSNGDPNGGLYHCADITFSRTAQFETPDSCKNGTGVTAVPLSGEAAARNANESTANGGAQNGGDSGHSHPSGTDTGAQPTSTNFAVALETAAWGAVGAAIAGAVALL